AWAEYLSRAGLTDFPTDAFLAQPRLPRVGIAISGGGNRACLVGAGVVQAADARVPGSVAAGTGGILQLSTYISALSGGSFLVGSMFATEFPTVDYLAKNVWKLSQNVFEPAGTDDVLAEAKLYWRLLKDVKAKEANGFPISITDFW
ncbi:lysophospholipase, partial [Blyttiomyces helicus]